jgi:Skp family chaperone for outer membrane proteins
VTITEIRPDSDLLKVYDAKLQEAGGGADFSNVNGCIEELQACNKGLVYLDHLYGRILDELAEAEQTWASVEADAAKAARDDAPKAATAVEIKGAMTEWVNNRPSASKARDAVQEARRRKEKIDRWIRSLEKRGNFAQSAQKGHEQLAKGGGG